MDILIHSLAYVFAPTVNWLIIAFAIINISFFYRTSKAIKNAENMFHPKSDKVERINPRMQWNREEITKLKAMRKKIITLYTWYANITAIFPLLGILGTVAALVIDSEEIENENFMIALSTTLFGVLFAIIFKGIDAKISGPLDVIIEDADYVIHQKHNGEKGYRNEA